MNISKKWLYIIAGITALYWFQKRSRSERTTISDDLTGMSVINGIKNPKQDLKPTGGIAK